MTIFMYQLLGSCATWSKRYSYLCYWINKGHLAMTKGRRWIMAGDVIKLVASLVQHSLSTREFVKHFSLRKTTDSGLFHTNLGQDRTGAQ